jgi:hypothetical protein
MKFKMVLTHIVIAGLLIGIQGCFGSGCGGDEGDTIVGPPTPPPDVLSNSYTGYLTLHFTNDVLPTFDETARIDVDVDKQGNMTFTSGTLSYDSDENNGQLRIRRAGTIRLNPNGKYFKNGDEECFDVKENSTVTETITTWVWNGTDWQQMMSETVTDTWNGGLVFYLADAEMNGSDCGVTLPTGSAVWTLGLIPSIVP